MDAVRRRLLAGIGFGLISQLGFVAAHAQTKPAVYLGLDLEAGHKSSTSDDAIRLGVQVAMEQINRAGGVLGGRPLALVERDNRSVPARAVENARALSQISDLVAVFCGKFSPVALELVPIVHELKLPLLDPWAAADKIVDNGRSPNYVFRLALKDSWAVPALLNHAQQRKLASIGVLAPTSSWGRSSVAAAERYQATNTGVKVSGVEWYSWGGEQSLIARYKRLIAGGANAILLVANETEGAMLVREMAALPAAERVPVLSHWGVTGGDFVTMAGPALSQVDFVVVQTFAFDQLPAAQGNRVLKELLRATGLDDAARMPSAVGFAHAYDLTHLIARAVDKAGTTNRSAVRDALEQLGPYDGLVRRYARPFTPERHEALALEDLIITRFDDKGALRRLGGSADRLARQ